MCCHKENESDSDGYKVVTKGPHKDSLEPRCKSVNSFFEAKDKSPKEVFIRKVLEF